MWYMQERRNAYIQCSGRKSEEKRADGKLQRRWECIQLSPLGGFNLYSHCNPQAGIIK